MKKTNWHTNLVIISALFLVFVSCNQLSFTTQTIPSPTRTVSVSPGPSTAQPVGSATLTSNPPGVTATPTQSIPTSPEPHKHRLVGYFYGLDTHNQLSGLPVDKLTTLIYAFIDVSTSGECISADPAADKVNLPQLQALKKQDPQLEILISVGGYSLSRNFSDAALTAASRSRFAQSCVQFMNKYGVDGIDVDWELPVSGGASGNIHRPEDKQNFTALLKELRNQLDAMGKNDVRHYFLTIAGPAGPSEYAHIDLTSIGQYLDWINLETYAVAVAGDPITNFNAPLFASTTDPTKDTQKRLYNNANAAVQAYLKAGVPADRILLGVPFYGRGWEQVPDHNHGLYQSHSLGEVIDPNVPKGTWKTGSTIDYQGIENYYLGTYTRYWNDEVKAAWLYNPDSGIMISYEDPQSLEAKADYVLANNLGGVMIWQLSQDDGQHTLLDSLYSRLQP
jgi:chitinase